MTAGRKSNPRVQAEACATLFVEVAGDLFDLGEGAEGVFAEDFADVGFGVAFFEEGVGDLGDVSDVLHAKRHYGAVEIGAEAYVVGTGDFYGVVDVVDDYGPVHFGEFAGLHEVADDLVAGGEFAGFVVAAALFDFGVDFFFGFGVGLFEVAEFLAEEVDVIVDLDDAAVFGEV